MPRMEYTIGPEGGEFEGRKCVFRLPTSKDALAIDLALPAISIERDDDDRYVGMTEEQIEAAEEERRANLTAHQREKEDKQAKQLGLRNLEFYDALILRCCITPPWTKQSPAQLDPKSGPIPIEEVATKVRTAIGEEFSKALQATREDGATLGNGSDGDPKK